MTHSHTAEEALALIGNSTTCAFDVIVVDQHMEMAGGVMKGSELVAVLSGRREDVWRNLRSMPVLIIASGDTDDALGLEQRAGISGCVDIWWTKPYPRSSQLVADIVPCLLANRLQPEIPPSSEGGAKVTPVVQQPARATEAIV